VRDGKQNNPERPEIRRRIVGFALGNLGRDVGGRAADALEDRVGGGRLGEAEVDQADIQEFVEKDVLGVDIARIKLYYCVC
jgi:hypothetical protein